MWADLVAWFQSPAGARVLQTAIVPAVAILVVGVIAALIARAALRSAIGRADREQAASAVAALVEAARAAGDPDGSRGDRRRVQRLRAEADVRLRLLPLRGAAAAADWAAARTDELQQRTADGAAGPGANELRDRLVAWVARPGRAPRLFAVAPVPAPPASAARASRPIPPARTPEPTASRDTAPVAVPAPAEPPRTDRSGSPAVADSSQADAVPAWRRTVSAKRLQEERIAGRAASAESGGAPAPVQHVHRADPAPSSDVDDAAHTDVHARHARPEDEGPQPAAPEGQDDRPDTTEDRPESAPDRRGSGPAWLDDYDDEAQVTQNMDLRTPPPVAATSVRTRSPSGEDIVPRT